MIQLAYNVISFVVVLAFVGLICTLAIAMAG